MKLLYDIDDLENFDYALVKRLHRLIAPPLERYFRFEARGLERIPAGAGLYVGNHSGGLIIPDSFLFGCALLRERAREDVPYGLAHEIAIQLPVLHQIVMPLGAVRASHENAHRIFAAGRKALVYPGSDYDDMRPFRDRNRVIFNGRRGYMRLALREGVPVIPVVACGSHETFVVLDDGQWLARAIRAHRWARSKVWPITLSIPWGLTVGPLPAYVPFPTWILLEVLEPMTFERMGPEAAADAAYVDACSLAVEAGMQAALDRLAEERAARGGALSGLLTGRPRPRPNGAPGRNGGSRRDNRGAP